MSLNDFEQTNALGRNTYFVLPDGESETYAPRDTPPKKVVLEPLALSRLPGAMRNMGWHTAAALMQRWFDSPAWEMPEDWKTTSMQPNALSLTAAQCDEAIVKMEWAMKFQRCREAMKNVESMLATPNALVLLEERLKDAGWKGESGFELGFYNMSAIQMDAICQLNALGFGGRWDTLDDMYGALGSATLKVGVVGKVFRTENSSMANPNYYFRVEHLGFYIRDHYDFNGPQYLGSWSEDRVLTKNETLSTFYPEGLIAVIQSRGPIATVWNGDFRAYRDKIRKGGDFIVYSDVSWKRHDLIIDLGEMT